MDIISFLPQEIIFHILTLLPPKSIGQCRSISKSWLSLLSHPRLTKTQVKQLSLILLSDPGSLFTVPLHTHFSNEIIEPVKKLNFIGSFDCWESIFAVCDGLVLLENNVGDIYLVNPVTREVRRVPPLPFGPNIKDCYNKYGVGYDSVNDDYKVLIVSYYRPCLAPENEEDDDDTDNDDVDVDIYDKTFVNVFSVKNGAWNEAECSPYDHGHDDSPIPGVFVNGYVHWIVYDGGVREYAIAAFDVVEETFSVVSPPDSWGKSSRSNLVEFRGDLCVYEGADYWIMKEYGNKDSWVRVKLKVDEGEFRPLCMLSERQMMLVKDEDGYEEAKFVKYDLEKETLNDIVVNGDSDEFEVEGTFIGTCEHSQGPRFCRETFVESLVSPYWSDHTTI